MKKTDGKDKYRPFDEDVEESGAYQYTDGSVLSARIANERYTQVILDATDFEGKTVVDVGAGDGTYTADLARLSGAAIVFGIEPSPKAIERAKTKYEGEFDNIKFRCGSSEDLVEEGLHYDIAVYRGVIHHVPDQAVELQRAIALAETVIILEPNGFNPLMKAVEVMSSYHREHQEQSFLPATVGRWVREAGGSVASVRYFGLVPYFCPDFVARAGHVMEPLVEALPLLRNLCCGQYLLVAHGNSV